MTELNEILKSAGLEDESVTKVLEQMKENKIFLASEENLDTRYSKLKEDKEASDSAKAEAEALIEELKAQTEGQNEAQSKISEYESTIETLKEESRRKDADNALKVALLEAGVDDLDYVSYKVKQDGDVELDKDGKIVGIDDKISDLKTKYPTQFAAEASDKKIEEKRLEKGDDNPTGVTKQEFSKMNYNQLAEFKQNNPEAFNTLSEG